MLLPSDICRCRDDGCPECQTCLRWIEREHGDVFAWSLFPFDISLADPCPNRIPAEDQD